MHYLINQITITTAYRDITKDETKLCFVYIINTGHPFFPLVHSGGVLKVNSRQSLCKEIKLFIAIQHAYPHILGANPEVLPTSSQYFVASKEAFTVLQFTFTFQPCKSCKRRKTVTIVLSLFFMNNQP